MSGIPRIAGAWAALLVSGAALAAGDAPVVSGALGKALDAHMTQLEVRGFSGALLVEKDGAPVVRKAYGWADRDAGRRATTATVFDLGSIAKQFTAAAILRLEVDGALATTEALHRFIPDAPPDKRAITLHHLLTHASGLRSDFAEGDYEPVGREEYIRRALASELLWAPGTRYQYSNAGHSLVAAVVEIVSGLSYEYTDEDESGATRYAYALRLRLGGRGDPARHAGRLAQRRQRDLHGRAAPLRGRGGADLRRVDRG